MWTRTIQIVLTRLLHVTLTTLHQHLGLGEQLLRRKLDERADDRARQASGGGHSFRVKQQQQRFRQRRLSSSDGELMGLIEGGGSNFEDLSAFTSFFSSTNNKPIELEQQKAT